MPAPLPGPARSPVAVSHPPPAAACRSPEGVLRGASPRWSAPCARRAQPLTNPRDAPSLAPPACAAVRPQAEVPERPASTAVATADPSTLQPEDFWSPAIEVRPEAAPPGPAFRPREALKR
jgi:hypothetical protein